MLAALGFVVRVKVDQAVVDGVRLHSEHPDIFDESPSVKIRLEIDAVFRS